MCLCGASVPRHPSRAVSAAVLPAEISWSPAEISGRTLHVSDILVKIKTPHFNERLKQQRCGRAHAAKPFISKAEGIAHDSCRRVRAGSVDSTGKHPGGSVANRMGLCMDIGRSAPVAAFTRAHDGGHRTKARPGLRQGADMKIRTGRYLGAAAIAIAALLGAPSAPVQAQQTSAAGITVGDSDLGGVVSSP